MRNTVKELLSMKKVLRLKIYNHQNFQRNEKSSKNLNLKSFENFN